MLDAALPDLDWTILPPGTERYRFPAPSGRLAAIALGRTGDPRVLLVPGATGSKEDFVLLAPLLADAGYRVESFDLAGQYESAAAGPVPGRRFGYELFVADLVAVLESGDTPVHVLGYSFAGLVAELTLARRPELFASLVLLTTPPGPGQTFRGVRWLGPVSGLVPPHSIASLMIWGIVTNFNHTQPGRLELARRRFGYTRRASLDEIMGLMKHTPDVRRELARSPVPKLIAVGDRDLWTVAQHRRFARRIRAELRVYPAGHSPCETTPHQLARDLLALYARGR
ncbi:alpha/beta hydrolase [Cryobacterium adonitolivorans]|uniref:Alpha/beta hydrolase n=2 Tax=Cryobacterium adonitolivorans TaxID=1259189 RepID=A0A4R8W9Y3_9MICO|nr:alpha/beta hydrolase [Cryobacterium adonitolivorans]TFC03546.1 alpha/beta hydrolase [Cryobacterium adonitolivorans]